MHFATPDSISTGGPEGIDAPSSSMAGAEAGAGGVGFEVVTSTLDLILPLFNGRGVVLKLVGRVTAVDCLPLPLPLCLLVDDGGSKSVVGSEGGRGDSVVVVVVKAVVPMEENAEGENECLSPSSSLLLCDGKSPKKGKSVAKRSSLNP